MKTIQGNLILTKKTFIWIKYDKRQSKIKYIAEGKFISIIKEINQAKISEDFSMLY